MNPETLKAMKEAADNAVRLNMTTVDQQTQQREINDFLPFVQHVSALITDYERVVEENERLKPTSPRCLTCGTVIASHCTKCIRDWES